MRVVHVVVWCVRGAVDLRVGLALFSSFKRKGG